MSRTKSSKSAKYETIEDASSANISYPAVYAYREIVISNHPQILDIYVLTLEISGVSGKCFSTLALNFCNSGLTRNCGLSTLSLRMQWYIRHSSPSAMSIKILDLGMNEPVRNWIIKGRNKSVDRRELYFMLGRNKLVDHDAHFSIYDIFTILIGFLSAVNVNKRFGSVEILCWKKEQTCPAYIVVYKCNGISSTWFHLGADSMEKSTRTTNQKP